jgi:hypothetical protein
MPDQGPIEDSYIDGIIRASGVFNPDLNKTQGIKLRELVKALRDRFEQELAATVAALQSETSARTAADTGLQGQVSAKVSQQAGYGLSQENYSTAEKSKLAGLSEHFKGSYTSEAALATANPSAAAGDYAYVDEGAGTDALLYIWDGDDHDWKLSSGGGTIPDATELAPGIVELATIAEALARTDDQRAMTALKTIALVLDEKKNVSYQINPVSLNEVSVYMENAGQVNSVLLSGATAAKLKVGQPGSYPDGAQSYPFAYAAGDRVFITYNYTDLNNASCNIKLKCKDN